MFFVFSKILGLVANPFIFLAILVIAAGLLLAAGLIRTGRIIAVAAACFVVLVGVLPTYFLLLSPLENRFPRTGWPVHVDGILVLGGGTEDGIIASRAVPPTNSSEPRLVAAFELARRYPNARVIFSGGSAQLSARTESEASDATYIFSQLGLDPSRVALENLSRNTSENISFSKLLAKPKPAEIWMLVTSAYHMPRAMEAAEAVKWRVIPWPSDYLTGKDARWNLFQIAGNFSKMNFALHEWSGLVVYRLTGRAGRIGPKEYRTEVRYAAEASHAN